MFGKVFVVFQELFVVFADIGHRNASVNSICAQPPPGNRGAFASLVSPGGGALANLARPGGRALANPGGTPGLLIRTLLTLKRGQHGEFPR